MIEVRCTNCRRPYPSQGAPFRCPTCGSLYDYSAPPIFDPSRVDAGAPGLWRYRHALGLLADAPVVTLGEGNTPLEWRKVFGRKVAFKLEYLNPTGSFKDRGSAPLVSFLCSRRVDAAVEDSSGNAGASFAAYAAKAGIRARIFVPAYTSGPKRDQIEAYGAELISIPGPRSNASQAVLQAAEAGAIYASHAYLPFGLPGYATVAFELYEQIGGAPGAVIVPAGQGNFLLSIGRGFQALQRAGLIEQMPRLVGVQAMACAPLWALFRYGAAGLGWVSEGQTLAEGVRIRHPMRGDAVMQMILGGEEHDETEGLFVAVEEGDILPGRDELARLGFKVEHTSSIVWSALAQTIDDLPDPVAVMLTGAGFKSGS